MGRLLNYDERGLEFSELPLLDVSFDEEPDPLMVDVLPTQEFDPFEPYQF